MKYMTAKEEDILTTQSYIKDAKEFLETVEKFRKQELAEA